MKTLLIMRHGKAEDAALGRLDRDRPLVERGEREAARIADELAAHGLMPDMVVASAAIRAHRTAEVVAERLGVERFLAHRSLYNAPSETYVEALRELPTDVNTVLLVGHNPTVEELVARWSGEELEMATAAVAHFALSIDDWPLLRLGDHHELLHFWQPKQFR
ncbi:MAG: SixA phosphatase family protein [Planctomycetota bacterium]